MSENLGTWSRCALLRLSSAKPEHVIDLNLRRISRSMNSSFWFHSIEYEPFCAFFFLSKTFYEYPKINGTKNTRLANPIEHAECDLNLSLGDLDCMVFFHILCFFFSYYCPLKYTIVVLNHLLILFLQFNTFGKSLYWSNHLHVNQEEETSRDPVSTENLVVFKVCRQSRKTFLLLYCLLCCLFFFLLFLSHYLRSAISLPFFIGSISYLASW